LQVRADSAFYIWSFILNLENRGIIYAITADQSKGMIKQIEAIGDFDSPTARCLIVPQMSAFIGHLKA
ncbi:MAG: hypothetical protein ACREAM_13960, partial [Blastocatellia bacterium]